MDPTKPCVLLWNAQSILNKLSEFKNFLISKTPHIVGICETWLRADITPKFENYMILRADRVGGRGGGVAFLVRKDLKFSLIPLQNFDDGFMEVLAIRVAFENCWGNFLLCYNPCKAIRKEEYVHYFQQIPSPQIILGDFNAHHRTWDPKLLRNEENVSGKNLFEVIMSQNFCLLNTPGMPTRIDPYTGRESTLDLCFGSGMFSIPFTFTTENNMGSDHFPVLIDYTNTAPLIYQSRRPRWHFNNNNRKWEEFRENVTLEVIDSSESQTVSQVTNIVVEAGKKSFYLGPGKICRKPSKPWWSEECSKAVALKRRAHRTWRKRPERFFQLEYRRLEAKAKRIIRRTKRICFRKFCAKLDFSVSSTFVWNFIRKISGFDVAHTFPLTQNGTLLLEDLAKAELLATFYIGIIGVENKLTNEIQLKSHLDICLLEMSANSINNPFTASEMQAQIHKLKAKKAIGVDNIANELIIHLPEDLQLCILNLFNEGWKEGFYQSIWKIQQIIPILKPNKDPSITSSYRPISLISCLGKLFEKMVQARLLWWLESSSLLPDNQCGFRPGRGTTDVLLQLEHGVFKGFKENKVTLVIFFDIEKAFDKASHLGILYKFCMLGLRGNSLNWLKSFFEERYFQVMIGNTKSSSYKVKTGVP